MRSPSDSASIVWRSAAALSAGVLAGCLVGGAAGAALAPGGLAVTWRSAALGAIPGVAAGLVVTPIVAWFGGARRSALRAWVLRHGRGFAVAAFAAPLVLCASSLAALALLPLVLRRVQIVEVSSFVALALVVGVLSATSAVALFAGQAWSNGARPRETIFRALLVPCAAGSVTAALLAAVAELCASLVPASLGVTPPIEALLTASQHVDVGGALHLFVTPALTLALFPLVVARRWVAPASWVGAAALIASLARANEAASVASVPGLRRATLNALQRMSDRDHDGHAGVFGGGDCDDHDSARHPGAVEIPGNGRDEDCDGADLSLSALRAIDVDDPMTPEVRAALSARSIPELDVVLLTIDALRADLHFAGNPLRVSPNLDRLAARSVVFDRAYATASYTLRSLSSMLTGRYPEEVVRTAQVVPRFGRRNVFLAERAVDERWRRILVPSNVTLAPGQGIIQGFSDRALELIPPQRAIPPALDDRIAARTALALLVPTGEGDRLLLWAHFIDPHDPYSSHPGFGDFGPGPRGAYWHEVAWTDAQVGRVIDALDALPEERRARTLLVVTADHGESLGEHSTFTHGTSLWEEQLRVPLMFYLPALPPRHVATRRSLIDLVPTLLDLMGLPKPPPRADDALSGVSLVPDLLGFDPAPRPLYASIPRESGAGQDQWAFVVGGLKLYQRGDACSLYDLDNDPHERVDLSSLRPRDLGRMRALLSAFRTRLRTIPPVSDPPQGW